MTSPATMQETPYAPIGGEQLRAWLLEQLFKTADCMRNREG